MSGLMQTTKSVRECDAAFYRRRGVTHTRGGNHKYKRERHRCLYHCINKMSNVAFEIAVIGLFHAISGGTFQKSELKASPCRLLFQVSGLVINP